MQIVIPAAEEHATWISPASTTGGGCIHIAVPGLVVVVIELLYGIEIDRLDGSVFGVA